jgi:hypothetical protein
MKHTTLSRENQPLKNNDQECGIFVETPSINKFDTRGNTSPEKLFYLFTAKILKEQIIFPGTSVMEL